MSYFAESLSQPTDTVALARNLGIDEGGLDQFLQFLESLSESERAALTNLAICGEQHGPLEALRSIPAEDIFLSSELKIFEAELSRDETDGDTFLPMSELVIVTKATRLCNLRCTYCHAWAEGPGNTMPFQVMVRAVKRLQSIRGVTHITYVWHGGEVTRLKPKFFRKFLWLQQYFKPKTLTIAN